MAGLLDSIFNTQEGRMGLGLLALGQAPRAQGFQGLLGLMENENAMKQQDMQRQLQQSQLDENKVQTQARQAQIDAAARKQAALPSLFSGAQGSAEQGQAAQQAALDWQRALQAGYSPDEIQKLAGLQNIGKQKVARTIKGMGQDGREYEYQVDEFGQRVGDGVAQFRAPILQDLGNKVVALDAYTLQQQQALPKGMTPDGAANYGLSAQRLAMDKQKAAFEQQQGGKPTFNADAGGFIYPPSASNPQGAVVPLSGFQKPLNDVQAKAQLFGTRMQEADKIMGQLEAAGKSYSTPGANLPIVGRAVNMLNTEQGQMLDQAKRDFTNAVLRRESGAAIAQSEFDSADKQYFPQIGDSDKVIAQKARARQIAIQGVLAEVPKGTKPLNVDGPKGAQQGQAKQVVKQGMYGGRKVVQYADGTVDYAD